MWTNDVQIAIFVQLVGVLVLIVDKNNLTWTKMSVRGQKWPYVDKNWPYVDDT